MKDDYLEQLDAEIQYFQEQYYLNDGTDITDMCTNIFCMMESINKKATYIAKHPKRAQNHYNNHSDGLFVKHVRKKHNLTQEAFGCLLGVSRELINKWENEKQPLPESRKIQISSTLKRDKDHEHPHNEHRT